MKEKNKKRDPFNKLFYNNRFIMIFSVVASIILWFVVSSSPDNEQPVHIDNVPVTINLSEYAKTNNLKVYGQSATAATVTVRGSPLILAGISNNDVMINVQNVDSVTQAGQYTLPLYATKQRSSLKTNYVVDSTTSPSSVSFMVDKELEKTFAVEDGTTYKVADNYYASSANYSWADSEEDLTEITLKGPESEMNQVSKVRVVYDFGGPLTETQTATTRLVLFDENDQEVTSKYITKSDTGELVSELQVSVNLVVLPKKELPLTVEFQNKPSGFNSSERVTIEPETLLVAGTQEQLSALDSIQLSPVDFATLNQDTKTVPATINLQGLENLSNYREAVISIDMSGMASKTVEVPVESVLTFANLASDKEASCLTATLPVTIVGPQDQIEGITEANIQAVVDLSGREILTGHAEMPVNLSITGNANFWIFGTDYKVNIEIKNKDG